MSKVSKFIRSTIFIMIAILMVLILTNVLQRKTTSGAWNYMSKVSGYKNELQNSIDVIAFGSSHMYCTLNPLELYEHSNITSFILATQQQPINATYYYIKEALKTQKPKVIILECYMATVPSSSQYTRDEGVAYDTVDPLPWSINKVELINEIIERNSRKNHYFNFIKYHTRWSSLTKNDYNFSYLNGHDPFYGYAWLTDQKEIAPLNDLDYTDYPVEPLDETALEALYKILELKKQENFELLFLVAPYSGAKQDKSKLKALHLFAENNNIPILDMNEHYRKMDLNEQTDFYDMGHLNVYGAKKASQFLNAYLHDTFSINGGQKPAVDDQWKKDIESYHALMLDVQ